MNTTDELRRRLDERGVDYRVSATGYSIDIGPYTTVYANRSDTTLDVSLRQVTPEQAIAATLGRGTCHVTVQDNLAETEGMGDIWLECDACHWQMPLEPSTPRFNFCPNCGHRIVDPTTNDVDAEVDDG